MEFCDEPAYSKLTKRHEDRGFVVDARSQISDRFPNVYSIVSAGSIF